MVACAFNEAAGDNSIVEWAFIFAEDGVALSKLSKSRICFELSDERSVVVVVESS